MDAHPNIRQLRHCKIVGTLGPASSSDEVIRELIAAGMDVARLNFSHGDHETHARNIERVRRLAREAQRSVAILQDLQGPKIRCGKVTNGSMAIEAGRTYVLEYGVEQTAPDVIPVDFRDVARDVKVGHRVLMDDGKLRFVVEAVQEGSVRITAQVGGVLTPRKGVNFPQSRLSLPAITEKDTRDLVFGVSQHVDFVALSFVQSADDVTHLKSIIRSLGSDVPVIAKIEMLTAMSEIDIIAEVADGLMVARGDLGVEGEVERVPALQRRIVDAAARRGRPVIVATQMLESMIANPRPTIAEVTDVANGVLDGADCLMLSGEVASGKYPVECVRRMAAIIQKVESWTFRRPMRYATEVESASDRTYPEHEAIARAACEAADMLNARAIVCLTLTGSIARLIARWRPSTPVFAISPRLDVVQRLGVVWGVYGMQNPLFYNTDHLLADLPNMLKSLHVTQPGDTVVITAGIPINQVRPTNTIKINTVT